MSTGIPQPPVRELPFGADCYAVNLQIRPPAGTRAALDRLRERIAETSGLAMSRAPVETLHLTVFSVVYVRAVYPDGPEAAWRAVEAPVTAALREVAGRTTPFVLTFDRAGMRGDAVLVQADPDPRLEAIRDAVEAAMHGRAPVFRATTTHSTLARLAEPVATPWTRPLSEWLDEPAIAWPVDGLRLVLERRYPALDETPIGSFTLSGA